MGKAENDEAMLYLIVTVNITNGPIYFKEGKASIDYVNTQYQHAGHSTNHEGKHRHRVLIKLINSFEA